MLGRLGGTASRRGDRRQGAKGSVVVVLAVVLVKVEAVVDTTSKSSCV
jgi:hypothetical protein